MWFTIQMHNTLAYDTPNRAIVLVLSSSDLKRTISKSVISGIFVAVFS